MKRSPQEIIKELEQTQEIIDLKELEMTFLKSKMTKLNLELAETTHIGNF